MPWEIESAIQSGPSPRVNQPDQPYLQPAGHELPEPNLPLLRLNLRALFGRSKLGDMGMNVI